VGTRHIIVGAGSAGCVLAARLTEDASTRVLVIEAGPSDNDARVRTPAAFNQLFRTSRDWAYWTEPQSRLNGRRIFWPRGRMLGGCSSINAMIWTRGHPRDFDEWARECGSEWSHESLQLMFRRAERFASAPSADFGTAGPQYISELRSPNPLSVAFVEATRQAGLPLARPGDPAECMGAGLCHVTQHRGRRWSTANGYLRPALGRPNLSLRTDALVTRLLVEQGRAIGVEFTAGGQTHIAHTEQGGEVLLCAGAVNSPQILMLSGLGPGDGLRSLGIDVLRDLPGVGRNLTDHLAAGIIQTITQPASLLGARSIPNVFRYLTTGRGMLSSNVAEACAFLADRLDSSVPEIELLFAPVMFVEEGLADPPGHGMTIAAIVLAPHSRGRIELASPDPRTPPRIHANYLSDAEGHDLRVLIDGTRAARKILASRVFDAYGGVEYMPGDDAVSDEDIAAHIRARAQQLYHPVGTCRMGSGPESVLDPALRLRGVDRLRVIDASVMPAIVRGHPNAAVMAIAEKAAEMIRKEKPGAVTRL
jgi:choline dehydrogenase